MFVDRKDEMKRLQKEYERKGSSFVVMYGRRRVGKTTLISEFIRDKNALFFLASEESESQNRLAFKDKAAEFTGSELLANADVKSWDIIFKTIVDAGFKGKPVIVIDEFQYIGRSNPAFPSIFQRIWEEILKTRNVMVIVCGSLISMMQSQVLSYESPLYGRRTAQICLRQIAFACYSEFFPSRTLRERVELYSITGGVPKYIEVFSACDDIFSAIETNILDRTSYLYDEPNYLLRQEVTEIGSYFSIIRAIAAGNSKLSAIASVLELKATGLTKYLKTLIDLDILEREVPVTEKNPETSKKGLYKIKDNYIRFWFAFIYPNRSFIESGNTRPVMVKLRNSLISKHTAYVYEDICREKMWELSAKGCWDFEFTAVGRWWDAHDKIDIAAIDEEGGNIILGECKFWQEPVGADILYALEEKSYRVEWKSGSRKVWYILFSVSGFTDELKALASKRADVMLSD